MEIHEAIRQARTNAKLGVNEAAEMLGTYGPTLSRMEKGGAGIKAGMLVKMSDLYKVSIDHLVSGRVVSQPSSLDLDKMEAVIKTIAEYVQRQSLSPTPAKLSKAIIQVYQAEVNHLNDHSEDEFDLSRHDGLIETIFEE